MPTYDSHYIFTFLYAGREGKEGAFNGTRLNNPEINKKIQSLTSETDLAKRNATIAELWKTLHEETIYIPLHNQTLAYAMKDTWNLPVSPENRIDMKLYEPVK